MIDKRLFLWTYLGVAGLSKLLLASSAYANSQLVTPSAVQENFVAQITNRSEVPVAQASTVIEITNIQLEPAGNGVNLVLETTAGPLLLPEPIVDGNSLSIDILNARLALPDSDIFQGDNLTSGLSIISVSQLGTEQVRILIVGTDAVPVVNSRFQGDIAIFNVSTADTAAVDTLRIVVTAEKTPEDPLDVPISLTVLTEDELIDGQINSIADVAANVPNFYFTPGDRVFNLYSVRGLGNSSNILVRDAVSFYIDDVPYDNVHQFFPSELFDLERIEVLRGAQSTLYGRNSQAGVVNIISRPPSEEPELRASVLFGDFDERQIQFSVSDSLVPDTLGLRLAGFYRGHNGFTDNILLDDNADEQSGLAGRANLVWTPSDDWNISLNVAASGTDDDASVYVPIDQDDPFEVSRSDNGEFELDVNTQSLRVGYEGDHLRFTSITSRSDTDYSYRAVNDDFGSISISDYDQEIFNQELRLQSPVDADQFQWIVGAYFQNRDFRIGDDLEVPLFFGTEVGESTYDQTTYAGFAQVDYEPTEDLTLTAGLRYEYWQEELNRDAQTFEFVDGTTAPAFFFPVSEISDSDIDGDVWLPRLAATYRFNPNFAAYSSISRGYRPGTHNYLAFSDDELFVEPENSWNYEIGLKTSWLDNRLGINLSAFYNDIDSAQVLVLDDSLLFADIFNAEARAIGAELEIRATPFDGFDIIGGFGYTDAEFTDNVNPFTGENFDGNQLLYAPDYTYNLAAQYRSPGGFFGRVELQGVGTVFFDDANTLKEDPFTIVNARIGYEFEKTGVYLFSNNLFDTEYVTLAFPDGLGGTLAGYGDRRTFGMEVRHQF
ncbi:MAG: TonB-dependent receptor [Cyanobacteria bacterium P01_H01_bin.105]